MPAEAVRKIPEPTSSWWWAKKEANAWQKYYFNSGAAQTQWGRVSPFHKGSQALSSPTSFGKSEGKIFALAFIQKMMLGRVYDMQYQLTLDPGNLFTGLVHPVSRNTSLKSRFHFTYCKYINTYTSLLWWHQTDKTVTGIKSRGKLRKPYQVNHKTENTNSIYFFYLLGWIINKRSDLFPYLWNSEGCPRSSCFSLCWCHVIRQ